NILAQRPPCSSVVLLLNGMNGVAPQSTAACRLAAALYALSAETSRTVKFRAVAPSRDGNCGESAAFSGRTAAAVTTFVRVPTVRWHFTHCACCRTLPYFSSNHLA